MILSKEPEESPGTQEEMAVSNGREVDACDVGVSVDRAGDSVTWTVSCIQQKHIQN